MRVSVGAAVVILLLLSSVGCAGRKNLKTFGLGPEYDCSDSTYDAVKKTKLDGHCEVVWDVAKIKGDERDDSHPEIALLAKRKRFLRPGRQDVIRLTHSGKIPFRYDIRLNSPAAVDQTACDVSPVKFDPDKDKSQTEHVLGPVQSNPTGPKECHYRFVFYPDDASKSEIDPHIKIGSGVL